MEVFKVLHNSLWSSAGEILGPPKRVPFPRRAKGSSYNCVVDIRKEEEPNGF